MKVTVRTTASLFQRKARAAPQRRTGTITKSGFRYGTMSIMNDTSGWLILTRPWVFRTKSGAKMNVVRCPA